MIVRNASNNSNDKVGNLLSLLFCNYIIPKNLGNVKEKREEIFLSFIYQSSLIKWVLPEEELPVVTTYPRDLA